MNVVIGVHGHPKFGHDGSVAVVVDGSVLAVVEEERMSRVKHAPKTLPSLALREALRIAGVSPDQVDCIAYPWVPGILGLDEVTVSELLRDWFATSLVVPFLQAPPVSYVLHHEAHFYSSLAYVRDGGCGTDVVGLVIDGRGEQSSGGAYFHSDAGLRHLWQVSLRGSLGAYYEAVTRVSGFGWGEEGKTMGLAAYGRGVLSGFPSPVDDRVSIESLRGRGDLMGLVQEFNNIRRSTREAVSAALTPGRMTFMERADVALSGQQQLEARLASWTVELLDENPSASHLTLSGGVALNCSANSVVASVCEARGVTLVIPPPASDTGVALGAACAIAHRYGQAVNLDTAFLGSNADVAGSAQSLASRGLRLEEVSLEVVACDIFEGLVVGWFDGRSELGPRALGNRAVLALPSTDRARDKVNFLKGRESWRPLAPIVTTSEFERSLRGTPNPYMLLTSSVLNSSLNAVCHVDGTTRPMVVDTSNAVLTALLGSVGTYSGTEALICTSFNGAGEPLVNSLEDAIASAEVMGLDSLAGPGWRIKLR